MWIDVEDAIHTTGHKRELVPYGIDVFDVRVYPGDDWNVLLERVEQLLRKFRAPDSLLVLTSKYRST